MEYFSKPSQACNKNNWLLAMGKKVVSSISTIIKNVMRIKFNFSDSQYRDSVSVSSGRSRGGTLNFASFNFVIY